MALDMLRSKFLDLKTLYYFVEFIISSLQGKAMSNINERQLHPQTD
jgi:hypothetical protein